MGNFNEELVKAGVMLAGEGLHPSSKGTRVRRSPNPEDFGAELTPGAREQEDRLRKQLADKK
jgi:hypothetical protein